jgi:hypothetical protein
MASSFKVTGGPKLLSKGKIISSAAAVKKPASNITVKQPGHNKTKTSFIG